MKNRGISLSRGNQNGSLGNGSVGNGMPEIVKIKSQQKSKVNKEQK
jgi:hypothetical protein